MAPAKAAAAQGPSRDMRAHILAVTCELMQEKGVRATSISDIAQAAGISKGTLYYYYSAKEDIVYDIADRNLAQITEEFTAWAGQMGRKSSPQTILTALVRRVLGAEDRGRLHLYLLSDALSGSRELADKFQRRYSDCLAAMAQALDSLLGPGPDNQPLAHLLLAVLNGLMVQRMCGIDPIPVDRIVELLCSMESAGPADGQSILETGRVGS